MDFSISRLFQLINKDILLYKKKVLLAIIVAIFVTFFATVLAHNLVSLNAGGGIQGLFLLYIFLLLIGGGFLTSTNLGDLRSVSSRISYVGIPASTLEKLVCKLLYTLPLYAGGVSLLIWIFFKGYMAMYGDVLPAEALGIAEKMSTVLPLYFLRLYVFGHAVALFFSFFYNTYASIKGALVCITAFLSFCFIRSFFITDRGFGLLENFGQSTWEVSSYLSMQPNAFMVLAPIFWVLSYFVFKRKSV